MHRSMEFVFFPSLSRFIENTKYQRLVGELTSRLTDELFWLKLAHDRSCTIDSDNERFFTDNPNPPRHYFI